MYIEIDRILTPMNHREIEYNAGKLSGCDIPDAFSCTELLQWLDDTGKKVFDEDLIMDYGTDCLRLYLMFENTPKEKDAPFYDSWQEGALEGIYKFLGRYRRMVLAAVEWNRCGKYSNIISAEHIEKMQEALADARQKIEKCIARGNTLPNRHNIVSVLMELQKLLQKELRTGEIVSELHTHAVETAVPHTGCKSAETGDFEGTSSKNDLSDEKITQICKDYIILTAPFAPNLSKILWQKLSIQVPIFVL